MHDVI